jgi:hypothetical protein
MMRDACSHPVRARARAPIAAACALAAAFALFAAPARAAGVATVSTPASASASMPSPPASASLPSPGFRDPGLPPALRPDAPPAERARALAAMRAAPRASGAALAAQVQRSLRESFDAADAAHRGALTRAQARAGGFGFIDRHFEEIDRRHAGEVTFADLQDFLARRAAAASASP